MNLRQYVDLIAVLPHRLGGMEKIYVASFLNSCNLSSLDVYMSCTFMLCYMTCMDLGTSLLPPLPVNTLAIFA